MLGLWLAENGGTTLSGIVEKLDEIRERVAAQSSRFPIVAKGAVISRDTDRRILASKTLEGSSWRHVARAPHGAVLRSTGHDRHPRPR